LRKQLITPVLRLLGVRRGVFILQNVELSGTREEPIVSDAAQRSGRHQLPVLFTVWLAGRGRFLWRATHRFLSHWKIAARGWSQISFRSADLAFYFARAFLRVSPHLNLKDLILWTNCGIRLAEVDAGLAREFFHSGGGVVFGVVPERRSPLLHLIQSYSTRQTGRTLTEGFHAAVKLAIEGKDNASVSGILELAAKIGRRSYYCNEILFLLDKIAGNVTGEDLCQRTLFLHVLDLAGQFPARSAIDLLSAVAPVIENTRSDSEGKASALLIERLLSQTEILVTTDTAGALNFFRCGQELLQLKDADLLDRWFELAGKFKQNRGRILPDLIANAPTATRSLVSAARHLDGNPVETIKNVFEITGKVGEHSLTAAAKCYLASPNLLNTMSISAYLEWAERGLAEFTERDQLAAYFAAESLSSQTAIFESGRSLYLDSILPVLTNYLRMLTGKDIPIVPRAQTYDLVEPYTEDAIGLPPVIEGEETPDQRFRLYKVLAAQRVGQIEFGTFEKGTDRLLAIGKDLLVRYPRIPPVRLNGNTDWHTLTALFPLTTLARRLFMILENARVQYTLEQKYHGLKRDIEFARSRRTAWRPPDQYLIDYEPILEQLFQETLGIMGGGRPLRIEHYSWLDKIREVLSANIYLKDSSVADTIRACVELYEFLDPEAPDSSLQREVQNSRADETRNDPPSRSDKDDRVEQSLILNEGDAPLMSAVSTVAEPVPESGILSTASAADADDAPMQVDRQPNVFYYDEWDGRINDYRPRWCRVVESEWRTGDLAFAKRTKAEYRGALSQIRSQFQMLRPSGLTRMQRQLDGEEFDLEALTDYMVDKRSRRTPAEHIYSQRQRRERDVSVCFLLDMSSSTHARISSKKNVLEVQKEALLLMSEALEAIGDAYAIYGFSSQGRKRVSFYRFKDFREAYGGQVQGRIGAASTLVNTRLGPAIRHASYRLNSQSSATRLLIVLSDARPSDEGYEWKNAIADTHMALKEAQTSGITPFCITFNAKSRGKELDEMFEGVGYTIIDDVLSLPERMPGIYRRLTT
jgi:nitric oxide reductase NorD protein